MAQINCFFIEFHGFFNDLCPKMGEFLTHKMVLSPSLLGWDTCDILAGNGTL
jgi:hypothetical protein